MEMNTAFSICFEKIEYHKLCRPLT